MQMNLLKSGKKGRKRVRPEMQFGGRFFKNYNPKCKRPLKTNKALHLVLRSTLAKGSMSLKNKKYESYIYETIERNAKKNGIKLYSYANAGNHLHLLIRVKQRDLYNRFIKAITGIIARKVLAAQRGTAKRIKFWDARPFSRVVSFSKNDFHKVKEYLLRNTLETIGWVPYINRSQKTPDKWKRFWSIALEQT